jgi:hypothetical protein
MIYLQDNFLSADEFMLMKSAALKYAHKKDNLYENENGWATSCLSLKNDPTLALLKFGIWQKDVLERIKKLLEKFVEPIPSLEIIWFNYCQNGYIITKHRDYTLKSDTIETLSKRFKVFIYAHEVWEESWGGKLCFESTEILPLPNRLVLYSADEMHWTTPMNTDQLRIFYGLRFGFPL